MNIYALSTGKGPSGIAIIRLSGKSTLKIVELITKKKSNVNGISFCKFYDPSNDSLIDEGLLLLFPAPNSFTGDNLAEFHVHGGNAVITCFLRVLSEQSNCRLAEPGEFTKIAFLNNKIDLIEAESIGDLIHSETELQRRQAVKMVQGYSSNHFNNLREKLIKSLSYIEAQIDFAEDDLPDNVLNEVQKTIKQIHSDIKIILNDNKVGEKIRDGFKVAIIGSVNAGKSSLLNLLSKREAAIVSAEEGTTRDIIETHLNIDGYPVILSDTAGIREAKNEVEKKGIQLALNKFREADLNIIVIDNSAKQLDNKIKNLIDENSIVVLNKSDITNVKKHNLQETILVSVKDNKNINKLIEKIKDKLSKKFITSNNVLVTRERHRTKLKECLKEIDNFLRKDQKKDIEMAAEDLRLATRHLGGIVGKVDVEEILGSIFKDFCIGK